MTKGTPQPRCNAMRLSMVPAPFAGNARIDLSPRSLRLRNAKGYPFFVLSVQLDGGLDCYLVCECGFRSFWDKIVQFRGALDAFHQFRRLRVCKNGVR